MKEALKNNTVEARSIKEWLDYNTFLTTVVKVMLDDNEFSNEDIIQVLCESKYTTKDVLIDLKIMAYVDNTRFEELRESYNALTRGLDKNKKGDASE